MEQLNGVMVFVEGILSFLSPCVLPILPVYLAILAKSKGEEEGLNEGVQGHKIRQFILVRNTFLFVLGIATTFFILGFGIGLFTNFINTYKRYFLIGGGLFVGVMGLFYVGDLQIPFLQRERKFHMKIKEMNPWIAYLLGFTFSFGWTPCIGPLLASVLVLASTSGSSFTGFILIGIYTLGFTIPFILLAIFSHTMLGWLERIKFKMGLLQKVGGYLLLVMGLILLVKGVKTPQLIRPQSQDTSPSITDAQNTQKEEGTQDEGANEADKKPMAPDFTLTDQYGTTHTLSIYKGKTVFLNFWATWCPPCKAEMPDIQDLYEARGLNEEDVIVLGVAFPNMGDEKSKEDIIKFLEDNQYSFPVVMDEEGELAYYYGISAFPTTFIINAEGEVEGYVRGMMARERMDELLDSLKDK